MGSQRSRRAPWTTSLSSSTSALPNQNVVAAALTEHSDRGHGKGDGDYYGNGNDNLGSNGYGNLSRNGYGEHTSHVAKGAAEAHRFCDPCAGSFAACNAL